MTKRLPVAALLVTAFLAALAPAVAAEARPCGALAVQSEGQLQLARVTAAGVRCAVARRVLADQLRAWEQGWNCHSAGVEAECTRDDSRAQYGPMSSRDCGSVGFERNTDFGAFSIRAKRTSCVRARRVARASRAHGIGSPPYAYRAKGFSCRGRVGTDVLPQVVYTCRKGRSTIGFTR